jgi:hypothetical protein
MFSVRLLDRKGLCACRRFCDLDAGSQASLLAAIVAMKRTRQRPQETACAIPPTALAQPKTSPLHLRLPWKVA